MLKVKGKSHISLTHSVIVSDKMKLIPPPNFYTFSRSRAMDDEWSTHHYECDRISYRSVHVRKVKIALNRNHIMRWITHARRAVARPPASVPIQWIRIAIPWWRPVMHIWIRIAAVQVVRIQFITTVSQRSIAIKCCQIHTSSTAINIFGPLNVHR